MIRLRVEADEDELKALEAMALEDPSTGLKIQKITRMEPGVLNEPILTGVVIVGLANAAARVIRRWMEHRETMQELRTVRFTELVEGRSKNLTMEDLKELDRIVG